MAATTILLVEDDLELGRGVVARLEREGFTVVWWTDLRSIEELAPMQLSLVLLDLMLPGGYGLDLLRLVRERSEVPVVVLSARNDPNDKVRALRLGADDYVTKPFWPDELVERVRARLRRPRLDAVQVIRALCIEIDLEARVATFEGRTLDLAPVEFAFLEALARRPGAAVTRAWLAEHVLHGGDASRSVDVHASRLRKKLGRPELIETVWGVGYRLAVPREG